MYVGGWVSVSSPPGGPQVPPPPPPALPPPNLPSSEGFGAPKKNIGFQGNFSREKTEIPLATSRHPKPCTQRKWAMTFTLGGKGQTCEQASSSNPRGAFRGGGKWCGRELDAKTDPGHHFPTGPNSTLPVSCVVWIWIGMYNQQWIISLSLKQTRKSKSQKF